MPLLPRTERFAIGLHATWGLLATSGGGLGGASDVGFVATCANPVDAHTTPMPMNRGSFVRMLHLAVVDADPRQRECPERQTEVAQRHVEVRAREEQVDDDAE
jgi:hypothetical protein